MSLIGTIAQNPYLSVPHKYKTVGPGIPACICGQVFEWRYEFNEHKNYYESQGAPNA